MDISGLKPCIEDVPVMAGDIIRDQRKLKQVISHLYDADMERRLFAAMVLGEVARLSPELIRKRWSRIFLAFDDTMSCWGITEALGEIARNYPELRGRIIPRLAKFKRDECSCQGFIWAVCRIGQADRKAIEHFIPDILSFLDSENVCMVGQAIWAAGELGLADAAAKVQESLHDDRELWLYENNGVAVKTIGRIARATLEKLGMHVR